MQIVQGARVNPYLLTRDVPDYSGFVSGVNRGISGLAEGVARAATGKKRSLVEVDRELDILQRQALKDKYGKEYNEIFEISKNARDRIKSRIKETGARGLSAPEFQDEIRDIRDEMLSHINGVESFYKGSNDLLDWAKKDPYTNVAAVQEAIDEIGSLPPSQRKDPNWADVLKKSPRTLNVEGFVSSNLKNVKPVEETIDEETDKYMNFYKVQYNPALYRRVGNEVVRKSIPETLEFVKEVAKSDPRFVALARDKARSLVEQQAAARGIGHIEINDKDLENRAIEGVMPLIFEEVLSKLPEDGELLPKKTLVKSDEKTVSRPPMSTEEKVKRDLNQKVESTMTSLRGNPDYLNLFAKQGQRGIGKFEVITGADGAPSEILYWENAPSFGNRWKLAKEPQRVKFDYNDIAGLITKIESYGQKASSVSREPEEKTGPKEGDSKTLSSGRKVVFRGGKWTAE